MSRDVNPHPEAKRGRAAQSYDERINLDGPPFDDGGPLVIRFEHGLGDAVESGCLLRGIFYRYPTLPLLVLVPRAFAGLHTGPWEVFTIGPDANGTPLGARAINWERIKRHGAYFDCRWWEAHESYHDRAATKAEKCLREVFGIPPDPDPPVLDVEIAPRRLEEAGQLAGQIGPFALVHYQARSYWQRKDLDHRVVDRLIEILRLRYGLIVLLVDVDRRSPLANRPGLVKIHEHHVDWNGRHGECELGRDPVALAALAAHSRINVGIDSGPGHLFGAVRAKAVICWRGLHPLHNYGPTRNVLHAVPVDHPRHIYGDQALGAEYFRRHYRHAVYEHQADLVELVCRELER